ncbi:MBOAT family O-acyltransferase [Mariniphaga sediminis]|uniref:MBOAT family O-acyltransferase n=1 Tax=Mariniphaga sediminis TaxID=1628158 RepID=UPI003561E613
MIFTSTSFLIFFTLFYLLYWFVTNKNLRIQNLLLLAGSYFFYALADWRLLAFLVAVSALNYFLGIYIEKTENQLRKRLLLNVGLIQGLGGLIYFKYFNFFIASFNEVLQSLHFNVHVRTLQILLPLGISFFTFKTISYILDVYKGKIEATKDWLVFFNYVSFFPTILSGPIDKARAFVPQLQKKRVFEYSLAVDGMRQILWGMFKKVVIADNILVYTDQIFSNYGSLSGSTLLLGAFLYTIQLYADFSGYSDMAIGLGRLLGFNVAKNFNFPFFAQNIADFWRKWHISLTSWLTEYVFTPLSIAFRDYGKLGLILAILINFVLIGIWHGANWTFAVFGFLHGCYFIPLILRGTMNKRKKIAKGKVLPSFRESLNMGATFLLVMLANIIFRADNIGHAWGYFLSILSNPLFSFSTAGIEGINVNPHLLIMLGLSIVMLIFGWFQRNKEHALQFQDMKTSRAFRWSIYYLLAVAIIYYQSSYKQFIYFQF